MYKSFIIFRFYSILNPNFEVFRFVLDSSDVKQKQENHAVCKVCKYKMWVCSYYTHTHDWKLYL